MDRERDLRPNGLAAKNSVTTPPMAGDPAFTELATERLVLRRLSPFDSAAIAGYRGLPEVARYQGWTHFALDDARALVDDMRDRHPGEPGKWMQLVIVPRGERELVGDLGLVIPEGEPDVVELGITIAPSGQRRGFAFESLVAVMAYAHRRLGVEVARAVVDWRNERSLGLFAKLGMTQVLELPVEAKGEVTRELVLEVTLRADYLARL